MKKTRKVVQANLRRLADGRYRLVSVPHGNHIAYFSGRGFHGRTGIRLQRGELRRVHLIHYVDGFRFKVL